MKTRSRRAAYRAFAPVATRWNDNDIYGHMNNVVHYALFDSSVNGWLIAEGALDPFHGDRIGLVVESGCTYHASLAFPDRITAGLRVDRVGNSSVHYAVGLFREDEEEVAAEGFFVHVYVDRATRRPRPLSPALRDAVQRLAA